MFILLFTCFLFIVLKFYLLEIKKKLLKNHVLYFCFKGSFYCNKLSQCFTNGLMAYIFKLLKLKAMSSSKIRMRCKRQRGYFY